MSRRRTSRDLLVFGLSLVIGVALTACAAPPDGTEHGAPPEGSRDRLIDNVIGALDGQEASDLQDLFPDQSKQDMQVVLEDCGSIDPAERTVSDLGEIVPYRYTVYLSGQSRTDGTARACYFQVEWEGTEGPWRISSESIAATSVPTRTPEGEWIVPSP